MPNEEKIIKEHCPKCGGRRACNVKGNFNRSWEQCDEHGNGMYGGDDHSLLQCRGCEDVFYLKSSWNSEELEFSYGEEIVPVTTAFTYPTPNNKQPSWTYDIAKKDQDLYWLLNEIYIADEHELKVITAIGIRTAIECSCGLLGIDLPRFAQKVDALKDKGWIGESEHGQLSVLIHAGNAAAHRGWAPSRDDVRKLLDVLESFIQRTILKTDDLNHMKNRIPAKKS